MDRHFIPDILDLSARVASELNRAKQSGWGAEETWHLIQQKAQTQFCVATVGSLASALGLLWTANPKAGPGSATLKAQYDDDDSLLINVDLSVSFLQSHMVAIAVVPNRPGLLRNGNRWDSKVNATTHNPASLAGTVAEALRRAGWSG